MNRRKFLSFMIKSTGVITAAPLIFDLGYKVQGGLYVPEITVERLNRAFLRAVQEMELDSRWPDTMLVSPRFYMAMARGAGKTEMTQEFIKASLRM